MLGISWIFISAVLLADFTVTPSNQSDDEYKTAEVALQSVLGLNNTGNGEAIKLLDKIEKVIGNIKSVFEGKSIVRPAYDDAKLEKFTDFIQNLIKRLKKYDDKDLVYFVTIFNNEIRKFNYKGCKFHELLENFNLRTFLSNMLSDLQNQSGVAIKNSLEAVANKIKQEKFNKNEKDMIDLINSVYRQDSVGKFQNFLAQIDSFKQSSDKTGLMNIIKEGLRSIIFDYYSQLNNNARNALKHEVNDFWNYLSRNEPQNLRNKINKKNKFTAKEILDQKPDLIKAIKKSEVKKQSLYLLNLINAPKSYKIRSFSNVEYGNINQRIQSDDEFIRVKAQDLDDNSGLPTVSPIIFTTRLFKTRRKMLTFKTLYPDLVPEWTSITQLPSRRFMSYRPLVRHHNAETRKLFRKRGRVKDRRLVKNLNVPAKVNGSNSRIPKMKTNYIKFRHRMPLKKIGLRSRKPTRQLTTYKARQKKLLRPFRANMGLGRSKLRKHRFRGHSSFTQFAYNYRRSNIQDSVNSDEGLSIDIPEEHDDKFRRSDTNLTHYDLGLQQTQLTGSSLAPVNIEINNTTVITRQNNKDLPNNKNKFIRFKEENTVFNIEDVNKIQNEYEIKPRVEDVNSTGIKISMVFDANIQPNDNWEAYETLHEEKRKNKRINNFYVKNKQDESSKFKIRAKDSGNETESIRNKHNKKTLPFDLKNNSKSIDVEGKYDTKQVVNEEMPLYDEIPHNKDKETENVKTDNDFRTFIEDYDNDLKQFTRYKATMKNNIAELGNYIKKDMETRTQSTLPSTTTTVIELITIPAVETAEPPTPGPLKIPSANEKQDLPDTTTVKAFFDANLIKHLMETKKHTTEAVRPNLALGRYFNRDGVVTDSMEKLKEEVAEATNFNYMEQ